jgi:protein-tyrosine phosphatase
VIIDFHSHILPGIDDGSKDLGTSLEMLKISKEQGIDYMVATPHFHATRISISHFLEAREEAYKCVSEHRESDMPKLIPGAEVAYFEGISEAEGIEKLTVGNTGLLLLEMPFGQWNQPMVSEVERLIEERHIQIILAHLERYLFVSGNRKYMRRVMELPLYVQINAGSLKEWRKSKRLVKMFKKQQAHLLGSDCHGVHYRPQNLAEGRQILQKKAGREVLNNIDSLGAKLLSINGEQQ